MGNRNAIGKKRKLKIGKFACNGIIIQWHRVGHAGIARAISAKCREGVGANKQFILNTDNPSSSMLSSSVTKSLSLTTNPTRASPILLRWISHKLLKIWPQLLERLSLGFLTCRQHWSVSIISYCCNDLKEELFYKTHSFHLLESCSVDRPISPDIMRRRMVCMQTAAPPLSVDADVSCSSPSQANNRLSSMYCCWYL